MFPFEDYCFNLGMLNYIHVIPSSNPAIGIRVVLAFYGEEVTLTGEQAARFVERARAANWMDPERSTTKELFIPTAPLNVIRQSRGG